MIGALCWLLGLQLLGEVLVRLLGWPIPGPVMGMALLMLVLVWQGGPSPALKSLSQALVQHLSLLYIPAGVGLIQHLGLLQREGVSMLLVIVLSTAVTMAVTGVLFQWLARHALADQDPEA